MLSQFSYIFLVLLFVTSLFIAEIDPGFILQRRLQDQIFEKMFDKTLSFTLIDATVSLTLVKNLCIRKSL